MTVAATAAFDNAEDLLHDANLLLDRDRYARCVALSVLAEEELSKAFILLVCARDKRWDSVIFNALRKHAHKQSIAHAMKAYAEWFIINLRKVEEINRFALIPSFPAALPNKDGIEGLLSQAEKILKKPKLDYIKQDALYVSLGKDIKLTSQPSKFTRADAEHQMMNTQKFAAFVKQAM